MSIGRIFVVLIMAWAASRWWQKQRSLTEQLRLQNLRFDAALANMGEGLCMFDGEKRLVVCNDRYAKLYQLPPELLQVGTPHGAIIAHRVAHGILKGETDVGAVQQKISAPIRGNLEPHRRAFGWAPHLCHPAPDRGTRLGRKPSGHFRATARRKAPG